MLNYSIMSLNEDHIEEFCADIEYQVKSGIATMPLFCMTLTPEGDPAIDKAELLCRVYEKYKARLDEMNIPSGVLMQATIGHGWKLNHASSFQKYTGMNSGAVTEVCCPLDEDFKSYIRAAAERIAKAHPHHIMLDDDFRLMARARHGGCACPLHLEEFKKLTGISATREEISAKIAERDPYYTEKFIKTQIDSLLACAYEIRAGIDSVDPSIPGSFCACGDSVEGAYEIACIMSGKGNPVTLRINNANYCAVDPRDFVQSMHRAATQISALSGKPDYILAETDTCPQNRYSTPAAKLHSHFTFTILEGAKGAKHWITRLATYEPNSGVAYRKKLAKYSKFYEALANINDDLTWLGCKIPVSYHPTHVINTSDPLPSWNNGWCSHVLDRLGLPMHFSPTGEGVCFFDGARDMLFTDDEIITLLSGNVVLDARSAMRLISRGFGKYLGVDVKARAADAPNASGEIFYHSGIQFGKAQPKIKEIIPITENIKIYSDVYHLRDGVHKDVIFPGVTSYKNELDGTVVVFAGETNFAFNLTEGFGFLNETRKAQLSAILRDLDALPVYYPEDAEVFVKAARMKDGSLLCTLLNMSLDVLEEIPLCMTREAKEIKMLKPNGQFEPISFKKCGDGLILDIAANVFDPVILMIS